MAGVNELVKVTLPDGRQFSRKIYILLKMFQMGCYCALNQHLSFL